MSFKPPHDETTKKTKTQMMYFLSLCHSKDANGIIYAVSVLSEEDLETGLPIQSFEIEYKIKLPSRIYF